MFNVQRSRFNSDLPPNRRRSQNAAPVRLRSGQGVGRFRLQTGDAELLDFIRDKIRRDGPVTFAWFMEQALYHPTRGYYSSGRAAIGRGGDYFTNVSVGPLFGQLLAGQFREMWETLGRPRPFTIVEQGAHDGRFAADALSEIESRMPEFFDAVRYIMIEPSADLRARQRATLEQRRQPRPMTAQRPCLETPSEQVGWSESLDTLEPFCGIHFSNELIDSFPVHLVCLEDVERSETSLDSARQVSRPEWREKYVALAGEDFVFVEGELSDDRLHARLRSIDSSPRYETEICLVAGDWIADVAEKLTRGYVLAVDYGYARAEYYAPERSAGTLRCYRSHRPVASPLMHVGEADITAHVEWTSIADRALCSGSQIVGFTDQHHFLTGLISDLSADQLGDAKSRRALQTLLQPEMLGRTFQLLALGRQIPPDTKLRGFKFGRDPKQQLGLR